MSLTLVVTGAQINATDLNQIINVLQQQSGGSEVGHWFAAGPTHTTNDAVSTYISLRSRGATPLSVTIDTADLSPTGGYGTAHSGQITQGGFQVYSIDTTGAGGNTNARAGGNWTAAF